MTHSAKRKDDTLNVDCRIYREGDRRPSASGQEVSYWSLGVHRASLDFSADWYESLLQVTRSCEATQPIGKAEWVAVDKASYLDSLGYTPPLLLDV